jgi:mycobactin lysine-N-oxygenase
VLAVDQNSQREGREMTSDLPLAVIGAGPKAAALSAKSFAAQQCGHYAPKILIIERDQVAANWFGQSGYTNGMQRLGSPPEKDVGFPYRHAEDTYPPDVINRVFSEFSWGAYLVSQRKYGHWIDKGRPSPFHKEWGNYLKWVISKCSSAVEVVIGELEGASQEHYGWQLALRRSGKIEKRDVCGLVITGPGPCKKPDFQIPEHERILFGDNFWQHANILNKLDWNAAEDYPIAVVGGGETAASVINYLADHFKDEFPISVLTRTGTIFSRGEGYYENLMFTENDKWQDLPDHIKREIIRRADRGVFSVGVVQKLALSGSVEHTMMEVTSVSVCRHDNGKLVINEGVKDERNCQLLIFAFGYDQKWFVRLLPKGVQKALDGESLKIGPDLSVIHPEVTQKLHLPMLAGLDQGPGFPNLSCLGTLSDRILGTYRKGARNSIRRPSSGRTSQRTVQGDTSSEAS